MSRQLYDEALADVKKIKEVAESDAKLAIIEAVTPRIRELIERELLSEASDDADDDEYGGVPKGEKLLNDDSVDESADVDECDGPMAEETYADIGEDTVVETTEDPLHVTHDVEAECSEMTEALARFQKTSKLIRETATFNKQVSRMIARVENMYGYVQSTKSDKQGVFEQQLESLYKGLNEIQETAEMAKNKKRLNEEDVTLKLTGLPDEMDLENIGVDLIAGDEEVDELPGDEHLAGDDMDIDGDEDMDLGGLELGGDEDGDELGLEDEEPVAEEGFEMGHDIDENTIVEIDESMLRREIAKFKKLKEHSGVDASVLGDFGGGKSEGDPWMDQDVDDEDGEGTVTVAEGLDDDLFSDAHPGHEGSTPLDPHSFDDDSVDVDLSDLDGPAHKHESLNKKLALETRLLARSKARVLALKSAIGQARAQKALKLEGKLRAEYKTTVARVDEGVAKVAKIKGALLAASKKKPVNEARDNRASKAVAGDKATQELRTQLAETNLTNMKLRMCNKLLQNENLNAKQKAQVIERLDEAKTEREAKLLYEGLTKAFAPKTIREGKDRQVIGSGSRPVRTASTTAPLHESNSPTLGDLDRWAKLAGIK